MKSSEFGSPMSIEVEMRRERVDSLRRVVAKLEVLLTELEQTRELSRTCPLRERETVVARHAELRKEAETQRWYFIVQREAMGLTDHADVFQMYPLPAALL